MLIQLSKLSSLILILISTINFSYSQTTFGPKAGVNIATIQAQVTNKNFPAELKTRLGYNIGAFAQKEFDNSLILRAEVLYSLKGTSYANDAGNYQLKTYEDLHYINLPLLIGLRPIRNVSLLAENLSLLLGAELGYFFEAWTFSKNMAGKRTATYGQIPSSYQPFDKALTVGVSYNVNAALEIEVRYNYGFKNIFADLNTGANRVFQLGLAYHFLKSPADTGNRKLPRPSKSPRYS